MKHSIAAVTKGTFTNRKATQMELLTRLPRFFVFFAACFGVALTASAQSNVSIISPTNGESIFAGKGAGQMAVGAVIGTPDPKVYTVTGVQITMGTVATPPVQVYNNIDLGNYSGM